MKRNNMIIIVAGAALAVAAIAAAASFQGGNKDQTSAPTISGGLVGDPVVNNGGDTGKIKDCGDCPGK
jgi:hypothetical protein